MSQLITYGLESDLATRKPYWTEFYREISCWSWNNNAFFKPKQTCHYSPYNLGINFPFVQKCLLYSTSPKNLPQEFPSKATIIASTFKTVSSSAPLNVTAPILPLMRQIECFLMFLPCYFLRRKKHEAVAEPQTNHHDAADMMDWEWSIPKWTSKFKNINCTE